MRLTPLLARVVRLAVVAIAFAFPLALTRGAVAAAPPVGSTNPDEALVEKLEKTKISVDYAPEDLVKVIEQLRTQQGLNVQVAWNVLDSAGVRKDKRVEIRLKDVSLAVFLDNLVRELDPSGENSFTWGIERGVVVITREGALRRNSILKAYDVRDLIESGYAIRRFASTPVLGLTTTGLEWVGGDKPAEATRPGGRGLGGGGGGGNIFGSPSSGPEGPTDMEKIEGLSSLIQEQVMPESWRDAGGDQGAIQVHNGVLFIRHTLQAHQEIRSFLDLLRAMQPAPLNVDVAIVRIASQRAAAIRAAAGEGFPVVSGKVADEIAFGAETDGVLFRSTIGGRDGEAAWISDITQTDIIAGEHAIVAQQVSARTPVIGEVHSGLEIIALPLVDLDGKRAGIDVQMAWKPAPTVEKAKDAVTIDRTTQRMRTVSSHSRCALGDAIVLTVPAAPSEGGASLAQDDWVIVRVRRAE